MYQNYLHSYCQVKSRTIIQYHLCITTLDSSSNTFMGEKCLERTRGRIQTKLTIVRSLEKRLTLGVIQGDLFLL